MCILGTIANKDFRVKNTQQQMPLLSFLDYMLRTGGHWSVIVLIVNTFISPSFYQLVEPLVGLFSLEIVNVAVDKRLHIFLKCILKTAAKKAESLRQKYCTRS